MNKKRFFLSLLSLVLVAAVSVGATLAFLSDTDDEVVNTFAFANGMEVKLQEQIEDDIVTTGNETITANDTKGYDYEGIVPGQELNKEPWVDFKTDVDAYLFIKISGFKADELDTETINTTNWELIASANDGTANGVYVYKNSSGKVIAPVTYDDFVDAIIFSTVTVGDFSDTTDFSSVTLDDVTIEVYAIQALGFDDAEAALEETPFAAPAPTSSPNT